MVLVHLEGVEIEFPFEPYDCQTKFMTEVVKSYNMKYDAALESPTGTGKTLSLLCATLAWLRKEKLQFVPSLQTAMALANREIPQLNSLIPKVYYCSRTHSQLAQVIRELKKTVYSGTKTVTLASRDQLCIHPRISEETNNRIKSTMCRSLVNKHQCHFYNKWKTCGSDELQKTYEPPGNILDIEDIVDAAKKHSQCPYYQTKNMKETAELILLPYNYLISPELRKIHDIELKGSIVIFDEAHNLESICEESTSVEFSTTDIALCIKELQTAIEKMQEDTEFIRSQLDQSKEVFGKTTEKKEEVAFDIGIASAVLEKVLELEKFIDIFYKDELKKSKSFRDFPGKIFDGAMVLKLLETVKITFDNAEEIIMLLRKTSEFLIEKLEANENKMLNKGALHKFENFLSVVFMSHPVYEAKNNPLADKLNYEQRKYPSQLKDYKLYMYKEKSNDTDPENKKICINYWCFSAGIAMLSLKQQGVRSIIVTSGTLSPLKSYMANIGLSFGSTLENRHAANSNRVICGALKKSNALGKAVELNGRFHNRHNEAYFIGVGNTLKDLAVTVPQGVLVFFASYGLMEATISVMQSCRKEQSAWDYISRFKKIVVEPKSKNDLIAARKDFSDAVRSKSGAMFLAVCRGKVSEGIDFADADSRAVAIVGIPFPPLKNPRILAKKMYLDNKHKATKGSTTLSGDEWYKTEAYRAVNQAVGRVLRHVDDFGIVALLDCRFATTSQSQFSSWLRPCMKNYEYIDQFKDVIKRFFEERSEDLGKSMERLLMQSPSKLMRTSKKRCFEEKEYCNVNFLAEDVENDEVQLVCTKEVSDNIENLATLGEKEDIAVHKRPRKVVIPVVPLTETVSTVSKQPTRKKIRLARPQAFSEISTEVNTIDQSQSATMQNSVLNNHENFPKNIQNILRQDDKLIKEKLKALGEETFTSVIGLLKSLKKGNNMNAIIKEMKKILLPSTPQMLVAISKFFTPDQREEVVSECIQYMGNV